MWIPGFPFLHDFSDPLVIIEPPFSMQMADDTADDAYDTGGYTVSFQDMSGAEWYKVPNSGSRDHIASQTDGRFMV